MIVIAINPRIMLGNRRKDSIKMRDMRHNLGLGLDKFRAIQVTIRWQRDAVQKPAP
jgi:hypothetical protein